MALPFVGLAGIAVIVFGAACLVSRRARPVGLAILGIAAVLLMFARVGIVRSPSSPPSPPSPVDLYNANLSTEHLVDQRQEVARLQAQRVEIVENQRLAARMDDAFVQISPDGSALETYPDGMQIKQNQWDLVRSIVRPSDSETVNAGGGWSGSHSSRSEVKLWILGAPLLALVVAFLALKNRKPTGSGLGWVIAGTAALLVLGFGYVGSSRRVEVRSSPPMLVMPDSDHVVISSNLTADMAQVHKEMISNLQEVAPSESIESILNRLTGPKIKLDQAAAPAANASQKELAAAARTILSASTPVADPFTQGWLVNAAKSIMKAAQETGEGRVQTSTGETVDQKSFSSSAVDLPPVDIEDPALDVEAIKPDWVDTLPRRVGNTRRVVVSTDPYSSVPEAYAALREKLRSAAQARVDELVKASNGGRHVNVPSLESMGITIDYILSELCPEPDFIETVNSSVGKMKRAHALLEFNEPQDQYLLGRWEAFARVQSIEVVGGISALTVAGLALVYGLLKLDTWTRGYYSKRLFLGVPAAIIAVFGVAVFWAMQ